MKTEYIDVDGRWGIAIVYGYDMMDWDDLFYYMRSFGLPRIKSQESVRVLARHNTGMTISNDDVRMSIMFISDATSESQWWDTAAHEARHVADAIIDYYGADYGEDAAHLTGYIMRRMVEEIAEPCYTR